VDRENEERALMERIVRQDMVAFETLYRRFQPRIGRFVMATTRRAAIVDEVCNDTMLVVWRRADSFDGRSRLSSWIFGIAWRQAMQAMRRAGPTATANELEAETVVDDGALSAVDSGLQREQARAALDAALGKLPPEQQAVVVLTYFEQLGYREIAEILGCPVDTVKTRMFHARRKLSRQMPGTAADWL